MQPCRAGRAENPSRPARLRCLGGRFGYIAVLWPSGYLLIPPPLLLQQLDDLPIRECAELAVDVCRVLISALGAVPAHPFSAVSIMDCSPPRAVTNKRFAVRHRERRRYSSRSNKSITACATSSSPIARLRQGVVHRAEAQATHFITEPICPASTPGVRRPLHPWSRCAIAIWGIPSSPSRRAGHLVQARGIRAQSQRPRL